MWGILGRNHDISWGTGEGGGEINCPQMSIEERLTKTGCLN